MVVTSVGSVWAGPTAPACHALARRCVAAAAKRKPQQKRQRKPKGQQQRLDIGFATDDERDEDDDAEPLTASPRLPAAPSPSQWREDMSPRPEDIYPVFPKQPVVTRMGSPGGGGGGKWSWDDAAAGAPPAEPPVPQWNPRTGFMRTRAQAEAEQRAAAAAVAAAAGAGATAGAAGDQASSGRPVAAAAAPGQGAAGAPPPPAVAVEAPGPASTPLAAVTKGQVLGSCASTAAGMVVAAFAMRAFAERGAAAVLGTDPELLAHLLRLPPGLESASNAAVAAGAAAAVTGARLMLLELWPALREATDTSNRQVLAPLGWPDVVLVSALSGASEELLFRGALIPATLPDWRGAALSAALFGALHNSGGRNAAFATWAAAVGAAYGAAYLYTGNVWVPACAHALANFASAAVWIARNGGDGRVGGGGAGGGGGPLGGSGGGSVPGT